jgi:hypothetical protein
MAITSHNRDRSWPTSPGQALSQRTQVRNVVQYVIGTANGQSQGFARRAGLGFHDAGDSGLAQRAGRQPIDRLRWKRDELSFRQGLNGTMDDIARVVRAPNIDN